MPTIDEQAEIIRDVAYEETLRDCEQDTDLLRSVVLDWIDAKDTAGHLLCISDDPEIQEDILGFRPADNEAAKINAAYESSRDTIVP